MKKLLQINMRKDRKRKKRFFHEQNIIFLTVVTGSLNVNHLDFTLLFKTEVVGQMRVLLHQH